MLARSMPEKVVTPIASRLPDPAPVANTIGRTPKMKDQAVIMTARKRCEAPARAASSAGSPDSRFTFENSTIRMALFAESPISMRRC